MSGRLCSIEECGRPAYCRTWCQGHYRRWGRTGSPGGPLQAMHRDPEESFAARTVWQGDCLLWTGARHGNGYGAMVVDGKQVPAHRYAYERERGPIPDGMQVDHTCHNPPCVNIEHLRPATPAENSQNKRLAGGATGIRGVSRRPSGRYEARVQASGQRWRKTFDTAEEADAWVTAIRREAHGEFCYDEVLR